MFVYATLLSEGVIFKHTQGAITPCHCSRKIPGRHHEAMSLSFLGMTQKQQSGEPQSNRASPDD